MKVAVVIVTFNRLVEVTECIHAVSVQTRRPDAILLVDNSDDRTTADHVAREFPHVQVIRPGRNVGGAGGFALGLEWAMARDFDWVWAMDDDAIASPSALETMLATAARAGNRLALIAPVVMESGTQRPIPSHWPALDTSSEAIRKYVGLDCLPLKWCSFVGPLIHMTAATRTHLPLADFFFHHDDVEYTSRLVQLGGGVLALSASVHHPRATESSAPMSDLRLTCAVRNSIWMVRFAEAMPMAARLRMVRDVLLFAAVDLKRSDRRHARLRVVGRAIREAFARRPRRVVVEGSTGEMA